MPKLKESKKKKNETMDICLKVKKTEKMNIDNLTFSSNTYAYKSETSSSLDNLKFYISAKVIHEVS